MIPTTQQKEARLFFRIYFPVVSADDDASEPVTNHGKTYQEESGTATSSRQDDRQVRQAVKGQVRSVVEHTGSKQQLLPTN